MTKDLTEQWKNGGLKKDKKYYTKDKLGRTYTKTYNKKGFKGLVEEVLCEVPNYEEWQQMKAFCEEFNALKVSEENAKLKELLKECIEVLNDAQRNYGYDDSIIDICSPIITKIDEVLK